MHPTLLLCRIAFSACILFFSTSLSAQTALLTFADSLQLNHPPLRPEMVKARQITRSQVLVMNGKKHQDTTVRQSIFYNTNTGLPDSSHMVARDSSRKGWRDTVVKRYYYDSSGRLSKIDSRGNNYSVEYSYEGDSIMTSRDFYYNAFMGKAIHRYNQQGQLIARSTFDKKGQFLQSVQVFYRSGLPDSVIQYNGNNRSSYHYYKHQWKNGKRVTEIYDLSAGHKRLVEKQEFGAWGNITRRITYDYYYRNKEFTGTYQYSPDGLLRSYEGHYHYSGARYGRDYQHFTD